MRRFVKASNSDTFSKRMVAMPAIIDQEWTLFIVVKPDLACSKYLESKRPPSPSNADDESIDARNLACVLFFSQSLSSVNDDKINKCYETILRYVMFNSGHRLYHVATIVDFRWLFVEWSRKNMLDSSSPFNPSTIPLVRCRVTIN